MKQVDIGELARTAIDSVEPLAIQRNIKIHYDANSNLLLTADPDEIEIIFNNLLSNAVKYNKEGGDVFFNIQNKGKNMVFKVEDTGIGISEENKEKLFKDFVRIKTHETRDITGSGLGLSITKGIVEQYQGIIDVDSKPGTGTTFTVSLPLN